MLITFPWQ